MSGRETDQRDRSPHRPTPRVSNPYCLVRESDDRIKSTLLFCLLLRGTLHEEVQHFEEFKKLAILTWKKVHCIATSPAFSVTQNT